MSLEEVAEPLIRRHIGRRLAEMRLRAGYTLDQAADLAERSRSTIIRVEEGAQNVRLRSHDLKVYLDIYSARKGERSVILSLAAAVRNGKEKPLSWWHRYGVDITAQDELYFVLESSASEIKDYHPGLVPGLLQTREYAELVHRIPSGFVDSQAIEGLTRFRMERQRILLSERSSKWFHFILDEAVIWRSVCGESSDIVVDQFKHLIKIGEESRVSIRVLPRSVGIHGIHGGANAGGAFRLMRFPADSNGDPVEPDTVYVETLGSPLLYDEPHIFARYEKMWRDIDQKALSVNDSRQFILANIGNIQ